MRIWPAMLWKLAVVSLMLSVASAQTAGPPSDPVLAVMQAELERSRSIKLEQFPSPYFIEYRVEDAKGFGVSASLGALLSEDSPDFRLLHARTRVGGHDFDDTNCVLTGMPGEAASFSQRLAGNASPEVLRRNLWLATDYAYKSSLASFARKQAALRNLAAKNDLPDFWKASPLRMVLPVADKPVDEDRWRSAVKQLSRVFEQFPSVQQSKVSFNWDQSVTRYANTEGTEYRVSDDMALVRVIAYSQAPDGMPLRMSYVAQAHTSEDLPPQEEIAQKTQEAAEVLTALVSSPVGEAYTGPVLFEPEAAAQILAELLRGNLTATRKPVSEPGRPASVREGELEGRMGARVLPEWMTVVDDPTQTQWRGRPLFGSFPLDMEGVPSKPLVMIDKGELQNLYLTRQPVAGPGASNGHARIPGRFGANLALPGNLFIRADQTSPLADLKKKLVEMATARNRPYALLVKKMDFPSIARMSDLRQLMASSRTSGDARPVSQPLLVYRVYADGREELVRGLEFRRLDTRSLRDITAASEETVQFDYMDNGSLMALTGVGSYVAGVSVVAPGILFDDLELEPIEGDWQKPPLVLPPPMGSPR